MLISGTNFDLENTTVTFGAGKAEIVNISATSITVKTPPSQLGAGPVTVTVTTPVGAAMAINAFTYINGGKAGPAPTVLAVTPASGPTTGGGRVLISGTNFDLTMSTVTFGAAAATVVSATATTLDVVVPPSLFGAGVVNVTVTTPGGAGTLANGYTYSNMNPNPNAIPAPALPPVVFAVAPAVGPVAGGTTVTISGTGFLAGATVKIGPVVCGTVTVVNATTVTCVTGASAAGVRNVVVTNPDAQSGTLVNGFTYQ